MSDLREIVAGRLRRAFARSGYSISQISLRTGLHPRTVRRVLAGESLSLASVEALSRVLRVDWTKEEG